MKEERKRSLVPDPIFGLLDIQKVDTVEEDDELSLTYETAEDEIVPLKVVEFYDPDLDLHKKIPSYLFMMGQDMVN